MNKSVMGTGPYPFGLIIPQETGIIFEHQCDGYACNQIQQEGIFIPLPKRYFRYEINEDQDLEYYYDEKDLPFEFEVVTFNDMNEQELLQAFMHEAYDWIIFKRWKDKRDYMARHFDKFIGKKMLLVYQNSD